MEEVANVLANFDTAQQTAFDAYTDAQTAEQTRLDELDQLLYGQVDPTLAPGDFNIGRTVSQGVAEENLGFLNALDFIGGLTGDAMTTMGGTVARGPAPEGGGVGEITLDERGRPQFGGGMFGQIAQGLLSDERAMNLTAEEEANTALAALASGELDAAALADILNMSTDQFMAAQSSGIDLAGILEGRDQFDQTMLAQGINPNTGLPYGFDTATGLTAAQQAQQDQFDIANLINPDTNMPYGFDPATGLTAGQTLAQENVELGLLSQGVDMRPTLTVMTPQGPQQLPNPDYGRPIGWDPETGMGIADANAMALAEEEMELSTVMAQADLLTNAAALSQVDNPFVQSFMNNLSATFADDVEGHSAVMQQITSALVASGSMELTDSNLANILKSLPPEYTPLVEQLVMDSLPDSVLSGGGDIFIDPEMAMGGGDASIINEMDSFKSMMPPSNESPVDSTVPTAAITKGNQIDPVSGIRYKDIENGTLANSDLKTRIEYLAGKDLAVLENKEILEDLLGGIPAFNNMTAAQIKQEANKYDMSWLTNALKIQSDLTRDIFYQDLEAQGIFDTGQYG